MRANLVALDQGSSEMRWIPSLESPESRNSDIDINESKSRFVVKNSVVEANWGMRVRSSIGKGVPASKKKTRGRFFC